MNDIFLNGLSLMRAGLRDAAENSARIAKGFSEDSEENAVESILDLRRNSFQVKAAAALIKTGTEIFQNTLDIVA